MKPKDPRGKGLKEKPIAVLVTYNLKTGETLGDKCNSIDEAWGLWHSIKDDFKNCLAGVLANGVARKNRAEKFVEGLK